MRAWSEKVARESKKVEIPEGGLGFGLDEQLALTRGRAERNGNGNGFAGFHATTTGADEDTTMREGNGGDGEAMVS